ncbi:hypothetical protein [Ideonella sp.]|jgi:hypothetical protein|uniref:hypothetical protein n=1 Tax=Ideonella sp. TaxID=1929293 RepID=UPI0037C17921
MAGLSVSSVRKDAYIFNRIDQGVNVGILTGLINTTLTGINSRGVAVGIDNSGAVPTRAFVYQKGQISWLTPLSDGASTYAAAINKLNVVVGHSNLEPTNTYASQRAASWTSPDTAQNLGSAYGFRTYATAINSSNLVVGGENAAWAHGILFKDGAATDLRNLLTADQKAIWWPVGPAYAINDQGLIAGAGARRVADGKFVAYLLRPLP